MKKVTLTVLCLLLLIPVMAQQKLESIDLIVDASDMIMPDIMDISIDLVYSDKDEQTALNRLNSRLDFQIQSIEKAGFPKEKIKLKSFSVDEISSWDSGKEKITGYKAVQSISIQIPVSDKALISRLLTEMSVLRNENVSISVNAILSDDLQSFVKNNLIKKAIADAKDKAQLIADALNVKLASVKSVEYGELYERPILRSNVRFVAPEIERERNKVSSSSYNLLGLSETELSEKIHIIWYVEK